MKAPLQSFPTLATLFDSIHANIVSLQRPSQGYTYLFTCINMYIHWPEAIPMSDAMVESCAWAVLSGWVSCFRVPLMITSDQGLSSCNSWEPQAIGQEHTIPKPTGWWNISTGWLVYGHQWRWSYCVPLWSQCMTPHSDCLVISSL